MANRKVLGGLVALLAATAATDAAAQQFLPLTTITSTVPANGDLNPYGVAIVPAGFPTGGALSPGDVLVSNFNNKKNLQGTGTTIISYTPNGEVAPKKKANVFFEGSGLGLTTALGVLKNGIVIVGNVPTTDGTIKTIQPGSLLFLDRNGNMVPPSPFTQNLKGPWDLTIRDFGPTAQVFVSNVLEGSVTRLDLAVTPTAVTVNSSTIIATGYTVKPNKAALILGPTGLAYDQDTDVLYVASTADNMIFAVPGAASRTSSGGVGNIAFQDPHLRGPLALVFAPNGDLLTANGDAVNADAKQPSEIVEFTPDGRFIAQTNVDAAQGGAFGMAVAPIGSSPRAPFRFVAVDDNTASIIVNDP